MTRSRATHEAAGRHGPGSVRIIGGRWKRSVLPVAAAAGLRPTPDRVRETLFNWLTHAFGDFAGVTVLDLFAGSGALGLEAASRGATRVTLVERDVGAVRALRATCVQLGATQVDIREGDAMTIGRQLRQSMQQFDLVLLDPPFTQGWIDTALPLATELCTPGGLIYVESEASLAEGAWARPELALYRADKAGEVFYHLLRRNKKES